MILSDLKAHKLEIDGEFRDVLEEFLLIASPLLSEIQKFNLNERNVENEISK